MDIAEVLDYLSTIIGEKKETLSTRSKWIKITHVSDKGVKHKHSDREGKEEKQRLYSKKELERYWNYLIERGKLSKEENPTKEKNPKSTRTPYYLLAILSQVPGVEVVKEPNPKTMREIIVLRWRGKKN